MGTHIILGGTGRIGSATAAALLARSEPVTIVTRGSSRADEWRRRGARVAIADVRDTASLRRVFRRGRALFLLNPPAPPSADTDAEELATIASITAALDGSGLEKIVALSTYGSRRGRRCGDLSTLYELERAVQAQSIPVSILRAAYYMSNWDSALDMARDAGVVQTLFPADLALPMVAPADLGDSAARLLLEPVQRTDLHHVEGPARYTPSDVAAAFAGALGRPVQALSVAREKWRETFRGLGFSEAAAESYVRMTSVTVDQPYCPRDAPERGKVSLEQYVAELVERTRSRA
jgi:uncharacterized protein YbjT (DUF2867 family)